MFIDFWVFSIHCHVIEVCTGRVLTLFSFLLVVSFNGKDRHFVDQSPGMIDFWWFSRL